MLIGFGLVLVLALTIPKITKLSFAEAVPASCLGIILNMYLFSAVGLLSVSPWITLAEIIALIIFAFIKCRKGAHRKNTGFASFSLSRIITPAHVGFAVLCAVVFYVGFGVKIFQWDEFSHWALTVKDMFYSRRLSIFPDSVTSFKSYPPGMALWQYFFMFWGNTWDDQVLVFAYNLFILFLMMPVFKGMTWDSLCRLNAEGKTPSVFLRISWKILCLGVVCFTVFCLPYFYYSPWDGAAWRGTYIDRALGFNFAYILFTWFSSRDHREKLHSVMAQIALGSAVLCLLKSTGITLVLLGLVIIAADMLFSGRIKDLLFCLIPLAALAVASLSWRIVLSAHQVENKWSFDMDRLGLILSGKAEPWMYDVIQGFPRKILHVNMQLIYGPVQISLIGMPVLWGILYVMINHEETGELKARTRRNVLSFLAVSLCFLIFLIGLLFLYLCSFSRAEAQNYASIERYSSEFILGITCSLLLYLIHVYNEHAEQHHIWKQVGCIGCLILFLFGSVSFVQVFKDLFQKQTAVEASYTFAGYSAYIPLEEKFGKHLTADDKVYLVGEGNPLSFYVLTYQLVPTKCSTDSEESHIVNNLSEKVQKLKDEHYTHVCLCNLYYDFAERNAEFFDDADEISTDTLYKIIWQEDGSMQLTKLN